MTLLLLSIPPFFTAVQSVMQHWSPCKDTHKERPTVLRPAFQPETGILSTWQTSESGMTPNPTLGYRERTSVTTTPQSFSFFPSYINIIRVESLYVQLLQNLKSRGWWSQKENILRPTGGGCHHSDLRIALGAVCVKAEKKKTREKECTGWIYTAESRERAEGREVEWGSAQSLGMKKEKTAVVRRIPH